MSRKQESLALAQPPRFGEAIRFWAYIGCISFGGPAGQIALLHQELVERRRWIDESRFLHAVNFCMALPGPEAQQLAIYCGWFLNGIPGGILAGSLFVLPSLFMLSALGWVYLTFGDLAAVQGCFDGIRPIVVALVVFAAYRLSRKVLKTPLLAGVALASFIALRVAGIGYPWVLAVAIVTGFLAGRYYRRGLLPTGTRAQIHPEISTIRPSARWILPLILLSGAIAWGMPLGFMNLWLGAPNLLTDLGVYFTQAALMGFGGAYALVPYVSEGMVEHHAWLTRQELVDSLALGETTPGPLLMMFSFMGYVAASKSAALASLPAPLPGFIGAAVVTWYTFLPSFVMVLMGAPLSERLRRHPDFEAILATISAAVVGVIMSLGVYLAAAVFGEATSLGMDRQSMMALSVGALGLLARGRISPLRAIVAGGVFGIALKFLDLPALVSLF
ncbi:MAG: chromate efflux transporter [Pseudomonadota bacterium]